MMNSDNSQAKRNVFEEWMKGDHVLIHVDCRKPGVNVPAHLAEEASLCLKVSYQFQGETSVSDTAVTSWLKFNGAYFECILPWESIWGLTNEKSENRIWPEDMPKELIKELAASKLQELKNKFLGKKAAKGDSETATPLAAAKSPERKLTRIK